MKRLEFEEHLMFSLVENRNLEKGKLGKIKDKLSKRLEIKVSTKLSSASFENYIRVHLFYKKDMKKVDQEIYSKFHLIAIKNLRKNDFSEFR